jgi:hypothetical protein
MQTPELKELRRQAEPLNLFVGEHREYRDPAARFFVAYAGVHEHGGIGKYQTAEQVRAILAEYAKPRKPLNGGESDLFTLRNLARPRGFWVGEHVDFDPCRGGGPYYIVPRRMSADEPNHMPLLKYATAQQVEEFLANY